VPTYDWTKVEPEIIRRLTAGEGLRQICRDKGMPDESSVRERMEHPSHSPHYTRARELGWGLVGEDLIEIADNSTNDWMDRETEKGRIERVLDREHIERTRIRLDTRKWMLAKMLPKVYGDRLNLDVTGDLSLTAFVGSTPKPTLGTLDVQAIPHVVPPKPAALDE
jgi:hypothetical protein